MVEVLGVSYSSSLQLLLMLAVVAMGGFVRGFTGFGSALVIIPALSLMIGPKEAVAAHAFMEIPTIVGLLPTAVRDADRRTVAPMLIVMLLTLPIGALVLKVIDQDVLKILISSIVLSMVCLMALGSSVVSQPSRYLAAGAGAIGGLFQGATGIGGPPIVTALLAQGKDAKTTRANVIAVMSSLVALSIAAFALYGIVTRLVLVTALVAAPACLLAMLFGSYVFRRLGHRMHRGFALAVLASTAIVTLVITVAEMTAD